MEAEAAGSSEVGLNHLLVGIQQEPTAAKYLGDAWDVEELRADERAPRP